MSEKVTNQKINKSVVWVDVLELAGKSKLWICENGSGSMTGELWEMPVDGTNSDEMKSSN